MSILFPNALKEPQEYLEAQALWRQLFDRIKCEVYRGPMWTQWIGGTLANGAPCYDGSMAIYSQYCEEWGKGIKIWLVDPTEDWATESYFHPIVEPSGEFGEVDSLDISCVLTEENVGGAEELIRLYMVEDLSPEAMIVRIGALFPVPQEEPLRHPVLVSLDYGLRKHFCALRGMLGNTVATYDATRTPGTLIKARFDFSRSTSDSPRVEIVAQAEEDSAGLLLTYRINSGDGRLLADGPSAVVSSDITASDDPDIANSWLREVRQFIADRQSLLDL